MSSLKFLHTIKILAIQKMQIGADKHGPFNPFNDKQNLPREGEEEQADSYNYAPMEAQKVLCQYKLSAEDREELLKMLSDLALSSLLLGVQWCEYEAALKERVSKGDNKNEKPGA